MYKIILLAKATKYQGLNCLQLPKLQKLIIKVPILKVHLKRKRRYEG